MQHLDAFAIFAKVGELNSISGAARSLGMPKAKVSRAIVRLERAYDVALLRRNTRNVMLTEIGRTLHERCTRVLHEMQNAEAEIAAYRGEPQGILKVGWSGDLGRNLLNDHLHEFLDRYPSIDLRCRVGERLLPELNGLDVVLHAGWLADSRLTVQKISNVRTYMTASRSYEEARGLPTCPEALVEHRVIGNYYFDQPMGEPGRLPAYVPPLEITRDGIRHAVPIWQRFATTDHGSILELVRRGQAIAPVSAALIGDELRSGMLLRVLPAYEIVNPVNLYALYTERSAVTPKLTVFLKFVHHLVGKQKEAWRAELDEEI